MPNDFSFIIVIKEKNPKEKKNGKVVQNIISNFLFILEQNYGCQYHFTPYTHRISYSIL